MTEHTRADRPEAGPKPRAGRRWLLLLLPVALLAASLSLGYLWNEDFWWYLSSGQAILEHGGIPEEDPFLYSGNTIGWVYHSWLWTVLVAALEGVGGLELVVVFHAVVALALVVLLYGSARADRLGLLNALAVVLVLATLRHRICGKAEMASWLLLAVFFLLLDRPGPFGWRRAVGLGALTVLWANLHGGYPLGIFLALCYAVGGWLEARLRRPLGKLGFGGFRAGGSRVPLWLPLLLFALAVADPRMLEERLAPFAFVTGAESVQPAGEAGNLLILEWRSPFDPAMADPSLRWLFFLAALAALGSFAWPRPRSLPRLLFVLGTVGLATTAIRHLGALSVAAALVLLANASERRSVAGTVAENRGARGPKKKVARPALRRGPSVLHPAAALLLAALLLASAFALQVARPGFEAGQSESFFTMRPAIACPRAADYLLASDLPGPIFNDYQLGAYLGYRLAPEREVFVDSRVMDPEVVVDYTAMMQSEARFRRAEERYGFRTAVLGNYSKSVRSPLGAALQKDPAWQLVYLDPLAVIYVKAERSVPAHAGSPRHDGEVPFLEPAARTAPLAALQRVFLNDFPANYLVEYLAVLGQLGEPREVVAMATEALGRTPEHPLLLRQRCAGRAVLGEIRTALEDCARAWELSPEDAQIAGLYASVLVHAGKRGEALGVLDEALARDPSDRRLRAQRRELTGRR